MTDNEQPILSVVMTVHDDADLLEQHLPAFLTQQCDARYEVIVVDDHSTDPTPDILMKLKGEYPNLYTTFLPKPVPMPNPYRKRLALTVGAKAAHSQWVVLADVHQPPLSDTAFAQLANVLATTDDQVVTAYFDQKKGETAVYCQTWTDLNEAKSLVVNMERLASQNHHKSHRFKRCGGLYDIIAVPRPLIHDALKLFCQDLRGSRLLGLKLSAVWRNLQNSPVKL